MQKAFAPTSSEVAELIRGALNDGHTVILPASVAGAESPLAATLGLTFKLTRAESLVLAKLLEGRPMSREALRGADSKAASGSKGVDVVIHRLRAKLAAHGVTIATIHKQGFAIDKATRDRVHAMLAENGVDIAGATTPSADQADREKRPAE